MSETEALKRITHLIGHEYWTGTAERTAPVFNPATGEITGRVDLASKELVDEVVRRSSKAAKRWGATSMTRRGRVLFAFRELLNANKEQIAEIITAEHGKTVADALGEVTRGLEVVEFACGIPHLLKGGHSENVSTSVDSYSLLQPLGVVGVISPFNFPAMVPMWFVPIAVAAGNAVILKPSEKDPSAVNAIAELWRRAGLPEDVVNVVHGDKEAVDALLDNREVKAISFVGSTPIARYVYERGTANGKRIQALGGAKNHMLVLPDADLELAADAAVSGGFGSAGERCMAVSVVLATESIADELVAMIAERVRTLKTGNGVGANDMGPIVTEQSRDRIAGYIAAGAEAGASLVIDGREGPFHGDPKGFFVGPTLFDHVSTDMSIYTDEIFGPVLAVVRVSGFEEGLGLINSNAYGNGSVIFTNDGGAARRFEVEVQTGMVGINVPVPVPMAYYSFGGWKDSLFGDSHAHGTEGVHFYTRSKTVTRRWPDPSARGLQLGFPQNN
ncbi:MAG: CoA-acylating methylmalonate-semialdehyde dehydrogenase [Propionibacteriaceae bacterium]|nr:CoA-acylating methylmalonate-semialdehyde dehydrogenase [Propionibacteriaceae bacterium]